ncbi:FimV family protein [Ketobacter sp.]|uniref:type IV pilus assembly protein FimV n=1 Tax=Ketobacter sp. TaxID=2083498 RepID=UPI000F12B2D2|nr:FimV/HubP family polar landmark protein [Ketobacter sp.]RLT97008.1 MAG: LysM peptidoglycan-binding domain-containing protein [Ketobacter sp.]
MRYKAMMLAGLALQAGVVNGMGLGQMDVQSYLGSPLHAQIGLLFPGDYQTSEIRVNLARQDVYSRFDARYVASHGDLQFDVVTQPDGSKAILVRSSKRIVEPFLDIVLELNWPTGTTYRRYNLLLDPPGYATRWREPQPALTPAQPRMGASARPMPDAGTVTRTETVPRADVTLEGRYRVQSGDSLWKVARAFRERTGLSTQATMDVLYRHNPQAFVNGDRNRIKLGALLSVPAAAVPQSHQQDPVASNPYPAAAPSISFTPETPVASPISDVEQLQAQLAALQSERAELVAFQQQVRAEMARLEQQREQMQSTIALAQQRQQEIAQSVNTTTPPPSLRAQPLPEMQPTQEPVQTPAQTATPLAVAQDLIGSEPQAGHQLIEKSGSGFWYLLGLLPMGVLIGFVGLRSRRVQQIKQTETLRDEDLYELVFGTKRDRSQSDSPEQLQKAIHQIKEKASHQEVLNKESQRAEEEASHDDVKQMIELYLMYHQYQRALAVIHSEIAKRPTRKDLRLYLMQVFAQTRDWDAFEEQMDVLQRMGDADLIEQAEQLRQDYMLEPLQRDAG